MTHILAARAAGDRYWHPQFTNDEADIVAEELRVSAGDYPPGTMFVIVSAMDVGSAIAVLNTAQHMVPA
jgi:hypothetical protein